MKKIILTINNFKFIENELIIECNNNYNIILPIKNGSIDFILLNELKERIGINEINNGDRVVVFYRITETRFNKLNIKPIKIIKRFNYIFNEMSDSENEII